MLNPAHQRRLLNYFFFASWLVLLYITHDTIHFAAAQEQGALAATFIVAAWLSYSGLYLLPALGLTRLAAYLAHRKHPPEQQAKTRLVYAVALAATGLTTLFFFANARLHELYGIFVNGFVINLVVTPGGLESLGGSDATTLGFILIALGILLFQAALLAIIHFVYRKRLNRPAMPRSLFKAVVALLLLATLADRGIYAYSDAFGQTEMLALSEDVPFYLGFTSRDLFRKMGFEVAREKKLAAVKGNQLNYPLHPLQLTKPATPYNIVWLVSESWRADTLNGEIMPATSAFAAQAQQFNNHYSGGNGTRVGVFTLFTGIPGTYWDSFLKEHRGAAIIDVLQKQQYQMSFYTSQSFTYPEFDQSIFSQVPHADLHQISDESLEDWQKDRINVQNMLEFIGRRNPDKPFFTYMFFESPHARYYFPPESVIRRPYRDDINYATLSKESLTSNITLIKNRYLNAVHHLDSQLARVFEYLRHNDLLKSTIVIVTGDHGEEFMENGFWGHNSSFSEQQVRPPLVLWVPGMRPAVHDKLTSHMDITATLMPRLGVTNPPEDYTLGIDLLSDQQHEHITLSDWSRMGYVDQTTKITLPMNMKGIGSGKVTGRRDEPLSAELTRQAFEREQPHLVEMMQEFGHFRRK